MHVIRESKFFLLCEKKFVILTFTMTKKTDDFVRGRILESYQSLNSYRAVSDHLLEDGISVSYVTVKNIVDADREKEQRKSTRKKKTQESRKASRQGSQVCQQGRESHWLRQRTWSAGLGK